MTSNDRRGEGVQQTLLDRIFWAWWVLIVTGVGSFVVWMFLQHFVEVAL